jgi:hypothetical protein
MKNNSSLVFFKDYLTFSIIQIPKGAIHARGRKSTLLDYCRYYGWK